MSGLTEGKFSFSYVLLNSLIKAYIRTLKLENSFEWRKLKDLDIVEKIS